MSNLCIKNISKPWLCEVCLTEICSYDANAFVKIIFFAFNHQITWTTVSLIKHLMQITVVWFNVSTLVWKECTYIPYNSPFHRPYIMLNKSERSHIKYLCCRGIMVGWWQCLTWRIKCHARTTVFLWLVRHSTKAPASLGFVLKSSSFTVSDH